MSEPNNSDLSPIMEHVLKSLFLQEEILESNWEKMQQCQVNYQETYETYTALKKNDEKSKRLMELKMSNSDYIKKIHFFADKLASFNEHIKTNQEIIPQNENNDDKQKENFTSRKDHIVECLETLQSKYKDETLDDQIRNVSQEMHSALQLENEIGESVKRLLDQMKRRNFSENKDVCSKCSRLADELGPNDDPEDIKKKLADKEKDVAILKLKIKRMKQTLME
ncbi:unnamed protein product [Phyllotreta striolata]|uniref:Uncharacterized protein n=1 Tax=Phyllotreta striolata TaxID=444603 RepID=A0A9N9TNF6_PHYSR|nr:unnamed protein product [Phyllotreta striolata]